MDYKGYESDAYRHAFSTGYIEAVRADETLNIKLNEAGVPANDRIRKPAGGMRNWLGNQRSGLESKGVFKRYVEESQRELRRRGASRC